MIDIRVLGLEYGKEKLYELKGKLYGHLSCSYETKKPDIGSEGCA